MNNKLFVVIKLISMIQCKVLDTEHSSLYENYTLK